MGSILRPFASQGFNARSGLTPADFNIVAGKLTKSQIKAGYEALKDIETLINKKDFGQRLTQACSDFYTRIPHDFG
jgi:hypothetical protein